MSRLLGGSWRFLAGWAGGVVGVRVCCFVWGLVGCVCVGRWVGDCVGCCGLLGGCRECGGCVGVVCGECAQVCLARVFCGWCSGVGWAGLGLGCVQLGSGMHGACDLVV